MFIAKMICILYIVLILSILSIPCGANDINIIGDVFPISGVEGTNFTYSAVIKFAHNDIDDPDIRGPLDIGLIISDGSASKSFPKSKGKFFGGGLSPDELIKMESDPFIFGPYRLSEHGLKNTDNLSYEFILTTVSGKELAREKKYGPKMIKFNINNVQYSKVPSYYFLPYPITIEVSDKPNLIPSIQLSFQGPLNGSEETAWSDYMDMRADGTTYTFSQPVDLSQFSKGGTFRFNFTYTNSTYDDTGSRDGYGPTTLGPFLLTIKPYSPRIAEPLAITRQVEYNNFSLKVLVEDDGATTMGNPVGCSASLVINHPNRGELVFNNSLATIQGKYLVFDWDKSSVPFNKSDILHSKKASLKARIIYWNENRKYGAKSTEYSFNLVDVIPYLVLEYDPVIHLAGNESEKGLIRATVTYVRGIGDLKINATGPKGSYESILKGSAAGSNRYLYEWEQEFNRSQAGNYTLSFTYLHDSLEGGRYEFEQKPEHSFSVVPIIIEFQNGSVTPTKGMWNGTYSYSVKVNSSVEADAILEIFNPCSSEWKDRGIRKITPETSNISWQIQPFSKNCSDLTPGKYRFRASFMRSDFSLTDAYEGPLIKDKPKVESGNAAVNITSESGQIKFSNASVTPPHSSGLNRYTYCVDVETQVPEADILLAVAHPNSNVFLPQQVLHYDGFNKTLCWSDVKINTNREGNASFKFLSPQSNSQDFLGPMIKAINVSGSVEPVMGVLQGFQIVDEFYYFNYSINIGNMSKDFTPWIELLVKPLNAGWRTIGERKQFHPSNGAVNWKEKPFANESFLGGTEFKFRIDDLETQAFSGPEIAVVYDEPSWSKTGTEYSYWAWFNSTKNLTIDLIYSDDGQHWRSANKPQSYSSNSGRVKKTWTGQEGHNEFEFDIKIEEEGRRP